MIKITDGVGIKFKYGGELYITLPRDKDNFEVETTITTYKDTTPWAQHFYASLRAHDLCCKKIGDTSDGIFWMNTQPKESLFDRVDVKMLAKKTIYGEGLGGRKIIEVKKGFPTGRFKNIEDCVEAILTTFKSNFGKGFILSGSNCESWEETKEWYLKEYGNKVKKK